MNVGLALHPFSDKTLNEQFLEISEKLNCEKEMLFSGQIDDNEHIITMYRYRLEVFRNKIEQSAVTKCVERQFAGLEYSVFVAMIYNKRFMNKNAKVTRGNVSQLENEMEQNLDYFTEWRSHVRSKREMQKDCDKQCISAQTLNNMRIQVWGFFQFCRYVFDSEMDVEFVPFLYSNQSSLESHFSQMRARGDGTAQRYARGIVCLETQKVSSPLRNNRMYIGDENETQLSSFEVATSTRGKRKECVYLTGCEKFLHPL